MPQSPSLGFELLTSNQDSKHVTVNASALILEAVSIGVVVSQTNTPPASPTNGQLYIVGAAGTGAFLGQNNKLALYDSTTWYFYSPKTNQTLYNTTLASYVRFGGSTWASVSLGGSSSPTTTKGDLIVRDATTDVRQPIGTDGQVLTADSTVANGLKWATPASGGAISGFSLLDKFNNQTPGSSAINWNVTNFGTGVLTGGSNQTSFSLTTTGLYLFQHNHNVRTGTANSNVTFFLTVNAGVSGNPVASYQSSHLLPTTGVPIGCSFSYIIQVTTAPFTFNINLSSPASISYNIADAVSKIFISKVG